MTYFILIGFALYRPGTQVQEWSWTPRAVRGRYIIIYYFKSYSKHFQSKGFYGWFGLQHKDSWTCITSSLTLRENRSKLYRGTAKLFWVLLYSYIYICVRFTFLLLSHKLKSWFTDGVLCVHRSASWGLSCCGVRCKIYFLQHISLTNSWFTFLTNYTQIALKSHL